MKQKRPRKKIKISDHLDYLNILKKLFNEKIINKRKLAKTIINKTGNKKAVNYKIQKLKEFGFNIKQKRVGKKLYYYLR